MTKWEFKRWTLFRDKYADTDYSEVHQAGWELVSVIHEEHIVYLYFKRPLEE